MNKYKKIKAKIKKFSLGKIKTFKETAKINLILKNHPPNFNSSRKKI
jgi:hypothetical protein